MDIADQLKRVTDAWDPKSPQCAFTHYFYNKVPAEHAQLYQMPPGANKENWDKAVAERPDAASVPVLAVGFDDLVKRKQQQDQQFNAFRVRMHEAADKLKNLSSRHELTTSVKLREMRDRHQKLTARILRLGIKVHLEAARGRTLTPDEELYTQQLRKLAHEANDPSTFGSLTECWARVQSFGSIQPSEHRVLNWQEDNSQLDKIADILAAQQKGIKFLAELLEEDLRLVDKALEVESS